MANGRQKICRCTMARSAGQELSAPQWIHMASTIRLQSGIVKEGRERGSKGMQTHC